MFHFLIKKIEDIFFLKTPIDVSCSNTSNGAKNNWEVEFSRNRRSHARQNDIISKDFLSNMRTQPAFQEARGQANSILEFGCGTGESAQQDKDRFSEDYVLFGYRHLRDGNFLC